MPSLADLRLAARDLVRRPLFTATVVLTLAVSLGATTAAFSFIDAVFFTRLPVRDQNRLVVMAAVDPSRSWLGQPWPVPWETRSRLAERRGAFDDVAAVVSWGAYPFAARDGDHIVHVRRSQVSGNFFDVLGARPVVGRLLRPDDDIKGAPATVVLSERVWRRDYGADPAIVGRLLFFAGGSHRVVGVAPAELSYPDESNAWCAVTPERVRLQGHGPDSTPFFLLGRMRRGLTPNAARGELEAVLHTLPTVNALYTVSTGPFAMPTHGSVTPFVNVVLGSTLRPALTVLFGAVALVLVIACTNVAGLLLARGIARAPEIAVRYALGGTPRRIIGYLLTESAILGALGGALGLALAVALIRAGVAAVPQDVPMIGTAHVNGLAVAFVVTITSLSVVAFGLAPALRETGQAPGRALRGSRVVTAAPVTMMGRRALVSAQVALALVVLSGAALLGRTLAALEATPLGFDPSHLLFFRQDYMVPSGSFPDSEYTQRAVASIERLEERMPVTTTFALPFTSAGPSAPYAVDGQPMAAPGQGPSVRFEYALDDYFAVMGIPLVRGRALTRHDDAHAPPVTIVNRAFAEHEWPGQDPLGHRVRFATDTMVGRWFTVVGVVGNVRFDDPAAAPAPIVYVNPRQLGGFGDPWYVLRTPGDPQRAAEPLERTIEALDPVLGLSRTITGPALLRTRLSRARILAVLFFALSTTALVLAAIGLFGVLSAFVRERRNEIAIRSALGATPAQLRSLVVGQAVVLSALGVGVGAPLAFGGARVLQSLVRDMRPANVLTLVLIAVVLIAVVAAATLGPTVRASHVDPRTALSTD